MKNQIFHVSLAELEEIIHSVQNDILVAVIEGKYTKSWMDYAEQIRDEFSFPPEYWDFLVDDIGLGLMRYYDWMTDLCWVNQKKIIVIIHQYKEFLSNKLSLKDNIMDGFKTGILPFWEEEVVRTVVDGEPKSFIVYLTD
jgi:hypothetical protein